MKAMRLKLGNTLKIDTQSRGHAGRKIISCTEDDVKAKYKFGGAVMESGNQGMDVIFATRSDGVEVVIKTRIKTKSFKNGADERGWRTTTEFQLNMPKSDQVCELYEVLETPVRYFIVMEKVEGRDLLEEIADGRIPHVDAREVVQDILQALTDMHKAGRIHKDLKLENVMVDMHSPKKMDAPGSPAAAKLIDFDTVEDWEPKSPKAHDVLGTDGYIAPEAYDGEYSPASDIYSVGVIMYKLLTGRFPSDSTIFDDQPGENYVGHKSMARIKERLRVEVIDFNKPPLNMCPEAKNLVQAMLAFAPDARPSAEESLQHAWFSIPFDMLKKMPKR